MSHLAQRKIHTRQKNSGDQFQVGFVMLLRFCLSVFVFLWYATFPYSLSHWWLWYFLYSVADWTITVYLSFTKHSYLSSPIFCTSKNLCLLMVEVRLFWLKYWTHYLCHQNRHRTYETPDWFCYLEFCDSLIPKVGNVFSRFLASSSVIPNFSQKSAIMLLILAADKKYSSKNSLDLAIPLFPPSTCSALNSCSMLSRTSARDKQGSFLHNSSRRKQRNRGVICGDCTSVIPIWITRLIQKAWCIYVKIVPGCIKIHQICFAMCQSLYFSESPEDW